MGRFSGNYINDNSLYCGTGSFFDELELCRSLCSNAIQNYFILVLPNYCSGASFFNEATNTNLAFSYS